MKIKKSNKKKITGCKKDKQLGSLSTELTKDNENITGPQETQILRVMNLK